LPPAQANDPESVRIEGDYPAAHSMDSAWFAVDQDGHIAYCETDEDGLLPHSAFILSWAYDEDVEARAEPLRQALTGGSLPREDEDDFWFDGKTLAGFGLFVYGSENNRAYLPWAYRRTFVPKQPLHVDQLPPAVRNALKGLTLSSVHFAEAKRIFPADHATCDGWGPVYLCSDGKTVRPIPGREEEYRTFCRDAGWPNKETAGLHFEGLDDEPPAKPRRKRKR
jgi:hypothetical protein